MQGELGYRKQTSGLRLCRGTTHLNLQHVYGLRLLDGDGLGRQHSDQDPFWFPRLFRDSLWGCSLQEVSNLWGGIGDKQQD